jgi:hypothetical protein
MARLVGVQVMWSAYMGRWLGLSFICYSFSPPSVGPSRHNVVRIMQTSLPDLLFNAQGIITADSHSASDSTPRAFPKTDLKRLEHWQTFTTDIHTATRDAMKTKGIVDGTNMIAGEALRRRPQDKPVGTRHPKLVVRKLIEPLAPLCYIFQAEYKPDWVADLLDLRASLESALQQIYSYIYDHKYGILSNFHRAQRV